MESVERVWVVGLNPHNRTFVTDRAPAIWKCRQGCIAVATCLDVLEHLSDPLAQLGAVCPSHERQSNCGDELVFL